MKLFGQDFKGIDWRTLNWKALWSFEGFFVIFIGLFLVFWVLFCLGMVYALLFQWEQMNAPAISSVSMMLAFTTWGVIHHIKEDKQEKREYQYWGELGNLYSLKLHKTYLGVSFLRGKFQNRFIYIHKIKKRRKARVPQIYTVVELNCKNLSGYTCQLSKENWFNRITKHFWLKKETTVGDKAFDRKFIIKSESKWFVNAILTEEIKEILNKLANITFDVLEIRKNKVYYKQKDSIDTTEKLHHIREIMYLMDKIADKLNNTQA